MIAYKHVTLLIEFQKFNNKIFIRRFDMKYSLSKFLTGLIFFPLMISSVSVRTAAMESHQDLSHDDEDIEEYYRTANSLEARIIENFLYGNGGILIGTTIEQKRDFINVFYLVSKSLYEHDEGIVSSRDNLGKHIRNNDKIFYRWLKHDATNDDREHFKMDDDDYETISTERYKAIEDKLREFFKKLFDGGYWGNNLKVLEYVCSQTTEYWMHDPRDNFDSDSDLNVYHNELEVNSEYEKAEREDPFEGLNIETVGKAKNYPLRDSQTTCPICLGKFFDESDPKNILVLSHCLHGFHEECLKEWLKKNDTCPHCKFNLCGEDPEKLDRWEA